MTLARKPLIDDVWSGSAAYCNAHYHHCLFVQVHKFSKFIHGTATLLPDMVAAVPYWIDDESVRPSMVQSASNYSLPTAAAE